MRKYRYYWVVDAYNCQVRRCECLASVFDHHKKLNHNPNVIWSRKEAVKILLDALEQNRKFSLERARECREAIKKYGGRQRSRPSAGSNPAR